MDEIVKMIKQFEDLTIVKEIIINLSNMIDKLNYEIVILYIK